MSDTKAMTGSNISAETARQARERLVARERLQSALVKLAVAEKALKGAGHSRPASLREETPKEGISGGSAAEAQSWNRRHSAASC